MLASCKQGSSSMVRAHPQQFKSYQAVYQSMRAENLANSCAVWRKGSWKQGNRCKTTFVVIRTLLPPYVSMR